jgi:hypothetical protein
MILPLNHLALCFVPFRLRGSVFRVTQEFAVGFYPLGSSISWRFVFVVVA